MNTATKLSACALAAITLVGCQSNQQIGSSGNDGVTASDIQQAKMLEDKLPDYLGLPAGDIQVAPGASVNRVTIRTSATAENSEMSDKKVIISKLKDLEIKNPDLKPIQLLVLPEDRWGNPTLIQR